MPAKKQVRRPAPSVKSKQSQKATEFKLIQGEAPDLFQREVNRHLADGWEILNIFVKHYDYVAAVRR